MSEQLALDHSLNLGVAERDMIQMFFYYYMEIRKKLFKFDISFNSINSILCNGNICGLKLGSSEMDFSPVQ